MIIHNDISSILNCAKETMFLVPDDYVLMLPPPFPKRNTSSTVQIATLQRLNERIQFMYGSIKGLKTSELRLIRL